MSARLPFERPERDSDAGPIASAGQLRRYNVILHKAADFGLLAVVGALRRLTRFAEAEAMARMWAVAHGGKAVVLATHLERAELFVEQFAEYGLRATLEPT